MSYDQIGQLFMIGFDGTAVSPELASFLKEYKPGGVILFSRNLESMAQTVELTQDLQRCSPHSPFLSPSIRRAAVSHDCRKTLRFSHRAKSSGDAALPNWPTPQPRRPPKSSGLSAST